MATPVEQGNVAADQKKLAVKPLKKLNPQALEFVGSRSTSEASRGSSRRSDAGSEDSNIAEMDPSDSPENPQNGRQYLSSYPSTLHHGYRASQGSQGWESPQGVLPPSTPFLSAHGQIGTDAALDDRARGDLSFRSSSPPPPGQMLPGIMMYPVYSHPHERSASPPAVYGPAGGSPPLAPGFISVPVTGGSPTTHHPTPLMYHPHEASPPPSLGSSPPGSGPHYIYMHHSGMHGPHPAHAYASGPAADGYAATGPIAVEHAARHVANMTLGRGPNTSGESQQSGSGHGRASARIARSHRAGGAYNPAEFEFNLAEAEAGGENARTTLMIRNIPNKYTQNLMLKMLDEAGFNGAFDFFYLPIDFRNRCGLGYAFVNMLTPGLAADIYKAFHNKRWDECVSRKVCQVTYARVQGRDNLVQHFKASKFPSEDPQYQPLVYSLEENEKHGAAMAVDPKPIHAFLGTDITEKSAEDESVEKEQQEGQISHRTSSPTEPDSEYITKSTAIPIQRKS